ncbi:hypothetical protein [Melioribacter sp. OK-6-Me]|uniref:hypothetical protein n=1 Tax=unclassified Melioribacter TaxID=2627329 RepID=UPI003EDB25CB
MKRLFILIMALMLMSACSTKKSPEDFLDANFVLVTVPQQNFDLSKRQKDYLLLFKHRFPSDEIREYFKINQMQFNEEINFLFSNNLIKKDDDNFQPAFPVISSDDYNDILNRLDSLIKDVRIIILDRLDNIENEYKKNKMSKPFNDIAYFVIRDYSIMKNISDYIIKVEPPLRGGDRFYAALFEKEILNNGRLRSKIIFEKDELKTIENISKITQKDLVEYFDRQIPRLVKYYLESSFKDQCSFREWLYWTVYIVADRVTDLLNKDGYINLPQQVELVMK